MLQATSGDGVIFREQFLSPASVAANGGTVTGTPVINKSFKGGLADYAVYNRKFRNLSNVSFRWRGTYDLANSEAYGAIFNISTGGGAYSNCYLHLGKNTAGTGLVMTVGNGTNIKQRNVDVTITATKIYEIVGVWDGTNMSLYADGVLANGTQTGTFTGAVPLQSAATFLLNRFTTAVFKSIQNIQLLEIYDKALTAEEITDLYEQDTIQEMDKPLIDLPLRSSYYKATGTQLLTDGDMEAADTSAWTAHNNATLSKVTSGGSQALRIAYNGTSHAGAKQTILTSGKRYKVTGTARGDGTSSPRISVGGSAVEWTGTASVSDQTFSVEVVATGTVMVFYSVMTTGYVEFDDVTVELMENLTENKGTLGGTAKKGDGSTTTTMSTQLVPHGESFDGGDYLTLSNTDTFEYNTPFTFGAVIEHKDLTASFNSAIISSLDVNQDYKGIEMGLTRSTGVTRFRLILVNAVTGNKYMEVGTVIPSFFKGTVFATYSGSGEASGIKLFIDGSPATMTIGMNGLASPTIKNGKQFLVGASWNSSSLTRFLTGKIYKPYVDSKELTPRQVKILSNRLMKGLNV